MRIELNIFTNSCKQFTNTNIINKTYNSFMSVFNYDGDVNIWCDPKPNIKFSKKYIKLLSKQFDNVYVTKSLSDGYVKAVKNSKSDFMFMLEHDWLFIKKNITHTLDEIIDEMIYGDLIHFRFNKRSNIIQAWDKELRQIQKYNKVPYCTTQAISNNPHIISTDKYKDNFLNKVVIKNKGNSGLEDKLSNKNLYGCIYGPINYPATIQHLDGSQKR